MNQVASIYRKAKHSYFLNYNKSTMEATNISTDHLYSKDLVQEITIDG